MGTNFTWEHVSPPCTRIGIWKQLMYIKTYTHMCTARFMCDNIFSNKNLKQNLIKYLDFWDHGVYSSQFTVYSLQSAFYILHFTVYSLQSTVYNLQSTVYSLQSTVYSLQSTVYSLQSEKMVLLVCFPCNFDVELCLHFRR